MGLSQDLRLDRLALGLSLGIEKRSLLVTLSCRTVPGAGDMTLILKLSFKAGYW